VRCAYPIYRYQNPHPPKNPASLLPSLHIQSSTTHLTRLSQTPPSNPKTHPDYPDKPVMKIITEVIFTSIVHSCFFSKIRMIATFRPRQKQSGKKCHIAFLITTMDRYSITPTYPILFFSFSKTSFAETGEIGNPRKIKYLQVMGFFLVLAFDENVQRLEVGGLCVCVCVWCGGGGYGGLVGG